MLDVASQLKGCKQLDVKRASRTASTPLTPTSFRANSRVAIRRDLRCRAATEAPVKPSRGASGLDVQGLRPTSPAAWKIVSQTLRDQKVRMMSPQELYFTINKEVPIIDIRPPSEFEDAHIDGSTNIPLYRPITGWDVRRVARRMAFAFFGVFNGTEVNPNFFDDILASINSEVGAVLVCNLGGTLDATKGNGAGTQSRSLMAAYEAVQMGARKVSVLKGGFLKWKRSGRPYINSDAQRRAVASSIDAIFASAKGKPVSKQSLPQEHALGERPAAAKPSHPAKLVKSSAAAAVAPSSRSTLIGSKDDIFGTAAASKRRRDPEGLPVYTPEELNIGQGGDTADCPFNCKCCF
ncbi:hypothetical protein WJX73_007261 [Symbiochloris irregularis]|uniref:Rhodanese domain-containing protein n=1 Tax=Symbiochloris irregularis TaxID=706552 RepID=A0AAW1P4G2_9CHLO